MKRLNLITKARSSAYIKQNECYVYSLTGQKIAPITIEIRETGQTKELPGVIEIITNPGIVSANNKRIASLASYQNIKQQFNII